MSTVAILEPDELRAAYDLFAGTILFGPATDASWPHASALYPPGRALGVREGHDLVATATAFGSRLAVPGGAQLPMAAVTRVGVRADRTRRGLLTAMMHHQLRDAAERGEVVATLRASQSRIYGRFGYGVATRGRGVRVRRSGAGWRDAAPGGGTVRLLSREDVLDVLPAVHERLALRRPGGMTRPPGWWSTMHGRDVAGTDVLLAAVHTGPDGDDGYAVATLAEPREDFERRPLGVSDLHAADVQVTAALWRFLLDVDLTGAVEAHLRPLDEPLELMLADRRDCAVTSAGDETWLRILDVPGALAALPCAGEPVRLGVRDALFPANSGVYLLGDGPARHVDAAPELECDVAALAMAYLGDTPPSALAATGWWRVHDADAVTRADRLLTGGVLPWCGTYF
ncbi:MAG: GNAT family N-acetyltransferase [Pseudonocardia sp.]